MINLTPDEARELVARQEFRYYARKIFLVPNNRHFHEQRINAAMLLEEKEPLQGALADFFYGCWYDVPHDVEAIFEQVQDRLPSTIKKAFRNCIDKTNYIDRSSVLATRWSVLVTPSLNEKTQRLRISSDDARDVAKEITNELMQAREENDLETIEVIENEFFSHCIARNDRLAFSLVWFRLGKSDWHFNERWNNCQRKLEQTDNAVS